MKKLSTLLFIFFILLNISLDAQTTLIPYGASWNYYDAGNEPSQISGLDWEDPGYNISGWSSGNTHLGYGDGDESTVINSSTLTAYVRHTFNVSNPSAFDNLDLALTYDDGAVIYLNGAEVWRQNMPGGTITYNTFSATTSSENAQATQNIASTLVTGNNVLAVEIHQRSSASSDISFDFRLVGNPLGSVSITRGPYLQKASSTNMTIKWRTGTSTESIIDYGTSLANLNSTVSDLTSKTEHEIEITGLQSNTTYYYRIRNNITTLIPETTDLYFRTHPAIGSQQPITAWFLGDCGTANNNQRAVRDAYYNYIGNNHTDMMIFLGDNAYNDGTDAQYQNAIFQNMYEDKLKNSVSWSCLGNHDGYSADSGTQTGPYYDIFSFPTAGESGGVASGTEAYYSWDYGNIHFIVLDSYDTNRSVGGAMYNWCLSDIQNTAADWIVALWHHPPYTKGSHNSDTESNLIDMRQNFLPMLEDNGVDLIMSGHSHSYERSYLLNGHYGNSGSFDASTHVVGQVGGNGRTDGTGAYSKTTDGPLAGDGAVYITAGSSGKISGGNLNHPAMIYSLNQLGSCILEVDGDTMNVKFIRETGAIDDYFSIAKDLNNCTPGTTCDDGDVCTTGDVYDVNCNCIGTFQDADSDGVCDANDQCPGTDDSVIGTACNDGDDCTTGDVYDNNCQCAGTYTDSDNDGVCDANDQCPGTDDSLIGTACDDGDDCTVGDTFDSNCGCVGTFVDTDNDGVCDANDQCPGTDDSIIGTSCNDGDDCTIGDNYDNSCNCAGVYTDDDGDGYCINDDPNDNDACIPDPNAGTCDPCSEILNDGFEGSFGNWNDGGNDCALSGNNPNSGTSSIRIRDNSGQSSSIYTNNLDFSSYGEIKIEFSFYPVGMENNEDFLLEISTDGGANYSLVQSWTSGTDFQNNVRYFPSVTINTIIFTTNTRLRIRCDASANNDAIYLDDVVISGCSVSCTEGGACDDGDNCTTGDTYDANCNCTGIFQDSDGDGVCDADDQCPGMDDNLIGTICDDLDNCTINDVYDVNCNCEGSYVDNDGDGLCIGDDPDDNDGCNPDPNSGACNPCNVIIYDNFETSFGNWVDGGKDCSRSTNLSNTGNYGVRIRDNNSSSSFYTANQNLSGISEIVIGFFYYGKGMDDGESFWLSISTNGGSSYSTIKTWVKGVDFENGSWVSESVAINASFTSSTKFKLQSNGNAKSDEMYFDDITFEQCGSSARRAFNSDKNTEQLINVYPNPANSDVFIEIESPLPGTHSLNILNLNGQVILNRHLKISGKVTEKIDIIKLKSGIYIIQLYYPDGSSQFKKLLVI